MVGWVTIKIKTENMDPFELSPHKEKVQGLGFHKGTWGVERFAVEEEAVKTFWELLKILEQKKGLR